MFHKFIKVLSSIFQRKEPFEWAAPVYREPKKVESEEERLQNIKWATEYRLRREEYEQQWRNCEWLVPELEALSQRWNKSYGYYTCYLEILHHPLMHAEYKSIPEHLRQFGFKLPSACMKFEKLSKEQKVQLIFSAFESQIEEGLTRENYLKEEVVKLSPQLKKKILDFLEGSEGFQKILYPKPTAINTFDETESFVVKNNSKIYRLRVGLYSSFHSD